MGNSNRDEANRVTPLGLASSPELKLWRAVLAAAAQDAVDDTFWACDGNFRSQTVKSRDMDYFINPSRSVYQVCYWAGLDPEYVLRKMKQVIKEKTNERKNVKNDMSEMQGQRVY